MKIFVVAGEPSGDRLGAALIAGLQQEVPHLELAGVGGSLMESEGLRSLFPMSDISVMGVTEILSQYGFLKKRLRQTAEAILSDPPDVLITIDLPEFCLRLARMVKAASDIRCVHYVAPTVWAWRSGRAEKMAAYVDQVLALLPFEPAYIEPTGMRCDFVGHPVVREPQADEAARAALKAELFGNDAPTLLLLPGSRKSEVQRLGAVFGDVLARLRTQQPQLNAVLVAAPSVAGLVKQELSSWATKPAVVTDPSRKAAAFGLADVALAASGTVSLELAAAGTPMVIAYDMSWLSRQIIGRMLKIDTVTLVNLVAESRTVPEFIGTQCRPDLIAPAVSKVLKDPDAQSEALCLTMERLGRGGPPPGLRAAQAVLSGLSDGKTRH